MTAPQLITRLLAAVGTLLMATVLVAVLSLSLGMSQDATTGRVQATLVPPARLADILLRPSSRLAQDTETRIILDIRLPRVILAGIVGASLALAGVAFQGLLRNPLADPYIVGTSAGAALGAALAIVLGVSATLPLAKPWFAFAFALATMYLVYRLAEIDGRIPIDTFLLAGVVVGSFVWAFVSFLLMAAQGRMKEVVFWLMGDLSAADWSLIGLAFPYLAAGAVALFLLAHPMNLLAAGEESAAHLGVRVERTKLLVLIFASLVTAGAVSVSGLIGFLGLMVPHTVRSIWGADHRVLLPAAAIAGAGFLIIADCAARVLLSPTEIPVGVITALLGAPFFFVVLRRRQSSFSS